MKTFDKQGNGIDLKENKVFVVSNAKSVNLQEACDYLGLNGGTFLVIAKDRANYNVVIIVYYDIGYYGNYTPDTFYKYNWNFSFTGSDIYSNLNFDMTTTIRVIPLDLFQR